MKAKRWNRKRLTATQYQDVEWMMAHVLNDMMKELIRAHPDPEKVGKLGVELQFYATLKRMRMRMGFNLYRDEADPVRFMVAFVDRWAPDAKVRARASKDVMFV